MKNYEISDKWHNTATEIWDIALMANTVNCIEIKVWESGKFKYILRSE